MANTAISQLYPFLRLILRDEQVLGDYAYADGDLLSAVRTVLALGEGPAGFALDGTIFAATAITPGLDDGGDALALILYEACRKLVTGEDGAISYRTRGISVVDEGQRKRDLLGDLELKVAAIRRGGVVFTTWQSVEAYISTGQTDQSFTEFQRSTIPPTLTV